MKKRSIWIDIFKGLAILLVILWHCRYEMNLVSRMCVGCHMPAFFFASGFNLKRGDPLAIYIGKRLKTIIWPLFVGTVLYWIVLPEFRQKIAEAAYTFDSFGPLWFLSTLFIALIASRAFLEVNHNWLHWILLLAWGILCVVISLKCAGNMPRYCYIPARTCVAAIIVLAGYSLRSYIEHTMTRWFTLLGVLYVVASWISIAEYSFDLHYGIIPNLFSYCFLAVSGSGGLMALSRIIERRKDTAIARSIAWLGRNSLVLMVIHYPLVIYSRSIFSSQSVRFVVVLCASVITTILINKFTPFVFSYPLGKK